MPKRPRKKYSRPQRPFDKARIIEENILKEKYGLKNKREIWKADAAIGRIRNLAKQLITKSDEEKKDFVKRLQKRGFEVSSIAEALALNKEHWLKRRLQTIIFAKGLANTPKQARQLLVHRHVSIGKQIVNIPSYQVAMQEEPQITLNIVLKTPKKKDKLKEIKDEVMDSDEGVPNEEASTSSEKVVQKEPSQKIQSAEKEIAQDVSEKSQELAEEVKDAEKEIAQDVAEGESKEKIEKETKDLAEKISGKEDKDQKEIEKEVKEKVKEIEEKQ
ncbi:30S ribosomal protein S4 [Candidatus Pacearchaeota archaeon]|nr:30S ribosomal protein S4 [Candidatus Pacearchaeota archaeon]